MAASQLIDALSAPCLFDHLVGEREELVWNLEAERLGGLEIDHQLELGWLHDRQIGWLCSCDYPARIGADLAVCVGQMRTIADEATGRDKLATIVNRRNFVICRQHDDLMRTANKEWIGADDERTTALG